MRPSLNPPPTVIRRRRGRARPWRDTQCLGAGGSYVATSGVVTSVGAASEAIPEVVTPEAVASEAIPEVATPEAVASEAIPEVATPEVVASEATPEVATPEAARPKAMMYALEGIELPRVEETLAFGEMVRRAVIRLRCQKSHSICLTGKRADGQRLKDHRHAHFLPLDEDRDGGLDRLLIYAAQGFGEEDLEALERLSQIHATRDRPAVRLRPLLEATEGPKSILTPSRTWRSLTPFSLPCFATRGGGHKARPRDLPEGQLKRELRKRGLPEPIKIESLESWFAPSGELRPWEDFLDKRFNGTRGYGLAGFRLTFADPLEGPLCLGFGCHFGLGVFGGGDSGQRDG